MKQRVIFLGTGPSCSIPQLGHVLAKSCAVCEEALHNPSSVLRRNNVSLLVCTVDDRGHEVYVQIDIGKTFRDSCLQWFTLYRIPKLHCLIITHPHADAIGGLDDLRDVQSSADFINREDGLYGYSTRNKIDVWLSKSTEAALRKSHEYIFAACNEEYIDRKVPLIKTRNFEDIPKSETIKGTNIDEDRVYGSFKLFGTTEITLIPVYHGGSYVAYGFGIGEGKNRIVYLSDVSHFPTESISLIDSFSPFDTLIIDALLIAQPHFAHLSLQEVLVLVHRWAPEKTYIVGGSCQLQNCDDWLQEQLTLMRGGGWKSGYSRGRRIEKLIDHLEAIPAPQVDRNRMRVLQLAIDGLCIDAEFLN